MNHIAEQDIISQANYQQIAEKLIENIELPTQKHEEWKYFPTQKIFKSEYNFDIDKNTLLLPEISHFFIQQENENRIIIENGVLREDLSIILDKNLILLPLKKAFLDKNLFDEISFSNHFEKFLNKEKIQQNPFIGWNCAFGADNGIFIFVAKNQIIQNPISIYHFQTSQKENTGFYTKILGRFEENSQAKINELQFSMGEMPTFGNILCDFSVATRANIQHHKVQKFHPQASQVHTSVITQAKDSVYTQVQVALEGKCVRNTMDILLDGQYVEANMYGLSLLANDTLVDNHTVADHLQPNSVSNELYKGIYQDKSQGVFNGKIYVRPDAQKTNAYQQNRNILLSENASVNTKPQLEIWADDVKCSHGATTGKLDENALFYLQARGISKQVAKALLVQAFAGEILEKISDEKLKIQLETQLVERFL